MIKISTSFMTLFFSIVVLSSSAIAAPANQGLNSKAKPKAKAGHKTYTFKSIKIKKKNIAIKYISMNAPIPVTPINCTALTEAEKLMHSFLTKNRARIKYCTNKTYTAADQLAAGCASVGVDQCQKNMYFLCSKDARFAYLDKRRKWIKQAKAKVIQLNRRIKKFQNIYN